MVITKEKILIFRKHTLKYVGVNVPDREIENDKVNVVSVNIWKFWVKGIQDFFVLFSHFFMSILNDFKQKIKKKTSSPPGACSVRYSYP